LAYVYFEDEPIKICHSSHTRDIFARDRDAPFVNAKANLAVLQKTSTNFEQADYLEKGGWATPPGAISPDYKLARACAEKLVQAKTAAQ
jgi:hypothetical protein